MNALLFALVDAVLEHHAQRADRVSAQHAQSPARRDYWRDVAEATWAHLGWWRSNWPMGATS